jgi:hypothetical protein
MCVAADELLCLICCRPLLYIIQYRQTETAIMAPHSAPLPAVSSAPVVDLLGDALRTRLASCGGDMHDVWDSSLLQRHSPELQEQAAMFLKQKVSLLAFRSC